MDPNTLFIVKAAGSAAAAVVGLLTAGTETGRETVGRMWAATKRPNKSGQTVAITTACNFPSVDSEMAGWADEMRDYLQTDLIWARAEPVSNSKIVTLDKYGRECQPIQVGIDRYGHIFSFSFARLGNFSEVYPGASPAFARWLQRKYMHKLHAFTTLDSLTDMPLPKLFSLLGVKKNKWIDVINEFETDKRYNKDGLEAIADITITHTVFNFSYTVTDVQGSIIVSRSLVNVFFDRKSCTDVLQNMSRFAVRDWATEGKLRPGDLHNPAIVAKLKVAHTHYGQVAATPIFPSQPERDPADLTTGKLHPVPGVHDVPLQVTEQPNYIMSESLKVPVPTQTPPPEAKVAGEYAALWFEAMEADFPVTLTVEDEEWVYFSRARAMYGVYTDTDPRIQALIPLFPDFQKWMAVRRYNAEINRPPTFWEIAQDWLARLPILNRWSRDEAEELAS